MVHPPVPHSISVVHSPLLQCSHGPSSYSISVPVVHPPVPQVSPWSIPLSHPLTRGPSFCVTQWFWGPVLQFHITWCAEIKLHKQAIMKICVGDLSAAQGHCCTGHKALLAELLFQLWAWGLGPQIRDQCLLWLIFLHVGVPGENPTSAA